MDSTFTLEKKTAIVVGAANGIGRATALAFAAAGARVACADVEEPGAKATAAEIEQGGAQALPVHLDVTDGASCRAAVKSRNPKRFARPSSRPNRASCSITSAIDWDMNSTCQPKPAVRAIIRLVSSNDRPPLPLALMRKPVKPPSFSFDNSASVIA